MKNNRTPLDVLILAIVASFIMIGCTRSLIGTSNLTQTPTPEPPPALFFPSPTFVPSLPTPFPTPPPSPTPEGVDTIITDTLNDGLDCRTGAQLSGALPPEVDIGAAWVEIISGEEPVILFNVRFPRLSDLQGVIEAGGVEFLGGIELLEPNGAIPAGDEDWYFNKTGNISYNFGWNREFGQLFAWKADFNGSEWEVQEGVFYPASLDKNRLEIQVPLAEIPVGSVWMAVATNFEICDAIGLEDDRPILPLQ